MRRRAAKFIAPATYESQNGQVSPSCFSIKQLHAISEPCTGSKIHGLNMDEAGWSSLLAAVQCSAAPSLGLASHRCSKTCSLQRLNFPSFFNAAASQNRNRDVRRT